MTKKARSRPKSRQRREESLTRDQIIEASIELLDLHGEGGLTFRALSERLVTGPGALYGHIANKSDLLIAACDDIVARTLKERVSGATPEAAIRTLALAIFDAIEAHPWVGSALTHTPGHFAIVRIVERIGQEVCALGVPDDAQRAVVSALLSYILGVAGQNAANSQLVRARGYDRSEVLEKVSAAWLRLDPKEYPFARKIAAQMRTHDDRVDFIVGIDLILRQFTEHNPLETS